jgi:hypothetical protein
MFESGHFFLAFSHIFYHWISDGTGVFVLPYFFAFLFSTIYHLTSIFVFLTSLYFSNSLAKEELVLFFLKSKWWEKAIL